MLDLNSPDLPADAEELLSSSHAFNRIIYAAGFFQEGRISELTNDQIESMLNVGERGLAYLMRAVLRKQEQLRELIVITSTSQFTPRQKEPVYNMVKAGAAMFGEAMSVDGRVDKTLVVAPAGTRTEFWDGQDCDDLDTMLDPVWVAGEIVKLRDDDFNYRFAKILRNEPRVEIVETR
jgi:short-subunit dehydrogenase